jgi:ankyrin repeat protein
MDDKWSFYCHCVKRNLKDLINENPDISLVIEETDAYNDTPLITASKLGNVKIAKFLLDNGANYEAKNKFGYTPLMYASMDNNVEIVRLLLSAGANLNEKNNYNETALFISFIKENIGTIKVLIEEGGADPNTKDLYGRFLYKQLGEVNMLKFNKFI